MQTKARIQTSQSPDTYAYERPKFDMQLRLKSFLTSLSIDLTNMQDALQKVLSAD